MMKELKVEMRAECRTKLGHWAEKGKCPILESASVVINSHSSSEVPPPSMPSPQPHAFQIHSTLYILSSNSRHPLLSTSKSNPRNLETYKTSHNPLGMEYHTKH
ncbi:hypothetical protein Dimus_020637 [Dionaea muscipula]